MKNCGHRFHSLVTSKDFIDGVLVKIISPKNNPPTIVQDKVLALIQVWGIIIQKVDIVTFIQLILAPETLKKGIILVVAVIVTELL